MKLSMRTLEVVIAMAAVLALAGCEKSAEQQQKEAAVAQQQLVYAQKNADKTVNDARQAGQKEVADAQKKSQDATADIKDAPSAATANAMLAPSRNDYIKRYRSQLETVDQKGKDIENRASAATGKAKSDLDATVKDLHDKRAAIGRQLDDAGTIAEASWGAFRSNLDMMFGVYKQSTDDAPHRN